MKTVRQLLDSKDGSILSITPNSPVYDALVVMSEKRVGALLVIDGGKLAGIFSERDYARGVAAKGRNNPDIRVSDMPVSEIMTPQHCLITVTPKDTVEHCLDLVSNKRIRHLPVVDGDKVVGVISIGDLVKETIEYQQQLIKQLESYIQS